jgi:hypothetical protein
LSDVKVKLVNTDTNADIGKPQLTRPGFNNLCAAGICTAFFTAAPNIKIIAMKDEYNVMEEKIDRLEICSADPKKCKIEVSISKKLKSGKVYDGCFFVNKGGKVDFKIRAVMQWSQYPEDMDIWMRQVQCAESVRQRYMCYEDSDGTPPFNSKNDRCQRAKFSGEHDVAWQTSVKELEEKSCYSKECSEEDNLRGGFETVMRGNEPDKSPVCEKSFPNQFPKWVNWASRYCENLHKINTGRLGDSSSGTYSQSYSGTKTGTESSDWDNAESYLLLDVDQREGYGPETITMHNPPPGDYQIVVDQFTKSVPSHMANNIMAAVPRVELTLGGGVGADQVMFRCKITETCARDYTKKDAHLWQAVTIKIVKSGQVHDEETNQLLDKYNIRLLRDNRQQPLTSVALPTTNKQESIIRWVSNRVGILYPTWEAYFEFKVDQYSGGELTEICYGECEGANKYTRENFGDCLKGDEFGVPYRVQT